MILILAAAAPASGADLELGPMLGHVGPGEARIWAKADGPAALSVRIGEKPDLSDAREVAGPALEPGSACMGTVVVPGLRPSTRYHYALRLDGKDAAAGPYPSFVTAPPDGAKTKFRFAFVSCLGQKGEEAAPGWEGLAAGPPVDLILMLGDNHYADTTAPAGQRAAYASHRDVAAFRRLAATTPVYGIWDDHDFGPNNGDGTAAGKERSLATFREHWANPAYGSDGAPGIWFAFARGDAGFWMLDGRYHRTPNGAPDDGTKTMLGPVQKAWLKRTLAASAAALKFVACGSEWQEQGTDDGWTSFDRERREIWGHLADRKVGGLLFLSGDRHFVAGYRIFDRWLEITSGPLGSRNALARIPPTAFLHENEGKMWCVYEADTTGPAPTATLEVWRAGAGLLHRRTFTADEIEGREAVTPLNGRPK